MGPRPAIRNSLQDLDHAIKELQQARIELAAVQHRVKTAQQGELVAFRIRALLIEPLGRINLVGRFVSSVLRRHNYFTRIQVKESNDA